MSLHRRTMNIPLIVLGVLSLFVAVLFLTVPVTQPQAIVVVSSSNTSATSTASSYSSTATSSSVYSTCGNIYTTQCYTYTSSTTSSNTSTTSTVTCMSNCNPPPNGPPAWWLDVVIGIFMVVGIVLILRGIAII